MAPHSSTLAWEIPWTKEPGRLQSMGSQRVGHDWATSLSLFTCTVRPNKPECQSLEQKKVYFRAKQEEWVANVQKPWTPPWFGWGVFKHEKFAVRTAGWLSSDQLMVLRNLMLILNLPSSTWWKTLVPEEELTDTVIYIPWERARTLPYHCSNFFFFLAMPLSLWDLSSPTRDWTQVLSSESRVLTTEPPRNFLQYYFLTGPPWFLHFLIPLINYCWISPLIFRKV